ncbi:hypothetical protein GCD22_02853 [Acidithiobacillus thiooxidans ATCC 19377]|uniref:Uncharacterized protein n=1 Tax=Acidithiobacillus thiooxidans ATCC 19377 TaxID=637390 RepID=A0A5P9XT07_ACITH|nr:hypothetical protein GCD22_02853 [Acidithiobacillus thiooxidans ATCC 19377]
MQAILQATPDPIKILLVFVRPDRTIQSYATPLPGGGLRYLEPGDPFLEGE